MKDMSVKKIVIGVIGILSSLCLFVGLFFTLLGGFFDIQPQGWVFYRLSGYELLFSGFSSDFNFLLNTCEYTSEQIKIMETVLRIITIIIFIEFILQIGITIFSLFRASYNRCVKNIRILIILGLIVSSLYALFGLLSYMDLQNKIDYGTTIYLSGGKAVTNSWMPFLGEMFLTVGFLICMKEMQHVPFQGKSLNAKTKVKNAVLYEISASMQVKSILNEEKRLIEKIKQYKDLWASEVITKSEFHLKKDDLLKNSAENLNKLRQTTKSYTNETENLVMELLKDYKQLLEEELISPLEFMEKKGLLLDCVIH